MLVAALRKLNIFTPHLQLHVFKLKTPCIVFLTFRKDHTPRLVELKLQRGRTCKHCKWCGKVWCYSSCLCCKRTWQSLFTLWFLRQICLFSEWRLYPCCSTLQQTLMYVNTDTPSVYTTPWLFCWLHSAEQHRNLCHTDSHPLSYNPFSNCEWNFISFVGPDWTKKLHFLCPEL